jgi:hypothetical protein
MSLPQCPTHCVSQVMFGHLDVLYLDVHGSYEIGAGREVRDLASACRHILPGVSDTRNPEELAAYLCFAVSVTGCVGVTHIPSCDLGERFSGILSLEAYAVVHRDVQQVFKETGKFHTEMISLSEQHRYFTMEFYEWFVIPFQQTTRDVWVGMDQWQTHLCVPP